MVRNSEARPKSQGEAATVSPRKPNYVRTVVIVTLLPPNSGIGVVGSECKVGARKRKEGRRRIAKRWGNGFWPRRNQD